MFCRFGFYPLHITPVFITAASPSALGGPAPTLRKGTGPHEGLDRKPIDFESVLNETVAAKNVQRLLAEQEHFD